MLKCAYLECAYFETQKVFSLLNLMDTFLNPLKPKEVGLATGGSTTRVKSSSSLGKLKSKLKNFINKERRYKKVDKKSKN